MKKRTLLALLLVLALLATSLAGCAQQSTADNPLAAPDSSADNASPNEEAAEPYRIAVIAPITGNGSQYGLAYQHAMEILRDKINAEGGIDGHELQLDFYDDKQDSKETLNAANLIVADGGYLAVIGSQTSGCSMAASPVLQKAGIPMFSPHAAHADYTATGDYIFSLAMPQAYLIAKTAEYMYNEYNSKKVACVYANDDWGNQNLTLFTKYFEELGGSVVEAVSYDSGNTKDFSSVLTKCAAAEPDTIFLITLYNEGILCVQQMNDLEIDIPIFCDSAMYKQEVVGILGEAANGLTMMNTMDIVNHSGDYEYLEEKYVAQYGGIIDSYVSQSYDCLNIVVDAIRANGPSRDGIRDYIANLTQYEGVSGVISMNKETRTPRKNMYALSIIDGEFQQLDYVAEADLDFVLN